MKLMGIILILVVSGSSSLWADPMKEHLCVAKLSTNPSESIVCDGVKASFSVMPKSFAPSNIPEFISSWIAALTEKVPNAKLISWKNSEQMQCVFSYAD